MGNIDLARVLSGLMGTLSLSTEQSRYSPDNGLLIVANHTSYVDPVLVAAALRRVGVADPVFLAAAGLWRIPVVGGLLRRGGHIPVYRGTARAAEALEHARRHLARGGTVVLYPEGRLPLRRDANDAAPGEFKSGAARLLLSTDVPVLPVGHAGARRVVSGGAVKEVAGAVTAWVRRPRVHVHVGSLARMDMRKVADATAWLRDAVTDKYLVAASAVAEPSVTLGRVP